MLSDVLDNLQATELKEKPLCSNAILFNFPVFHHIEGDGQFSLLVFMTCVVYILMNMFSDRCS